MRASLAIVLTLAATPVAAATADWPSRLTAGEVPVEAHADGQGRGAVRAAIDIAASPSVVWRAILDCGRAARMTPRVKRCQVVSRAPDGRSEVREHLVKWSFFLPALRSTSRVEFDPERTIRFTCIAGDIPACAGSWRLEPMDEGRRTRVSYDMWATSPLPVPTAMIGGMMRRDVPDALKALRRECETR